MAESKKEKLTNNALVNYIQASFQELRKVTWPTKNQAMRVTFLVLGFCIVTAAILGAVDYVLGLGHNYLLDLAPQQAVVQENPTTTTVPTKDITAGNTQGSPVTVEGEPASASNSAPTETTKQ